MNTLLFLKNRTLKHIIFWVLYLLMWVILDILYGIPYKEAVYNYLGCILEIPFYYVHMYYLWPKFIANKKYFLYFITFIPLLLLNSFLVHLFNYHIVFQLLLEVTDLPENFFSFPRVLGLARGILLWFGPPTAIKILRDYYDHKVNLEKIEKEQKISELNFLKSQMNPHFLFNTLNNLYSLSMKGAKKTPEAILQLSNLLSYMLYEGTKDKVTLEKEIHHLNDYIELEKLRFGNRLNLQLEMFGDFGKIMVSPMIIIPLAENAFKHCSLNERGKIDIKMKIEAIGGELHINTINPVVNTEKKNDNNGIGIKNLNKRLQIIYPQKHIFNIREYDQKFHVNLTIAIDE